jgi:hypothetical protein
MFLNLNKCSIFASISLKFMFQVSQPASGAKVKSYQNIRYDEIEILGSGIFLGNIPVF